MPWHVEACHTGSNCDQPLSGPFEHFIDAVEVAFIFVRASDWPRVSVIDLENGHHCYTFHREKGKYGQWYEVNWEDFYGDLLEEAEYKPVTVEALTQDAVGCYRESMTFLGWLRRECPLTKPAYV